MADPFTTDTRIMGVLVDVQHQTELAQDIFKKTTAIQAGTIALLADGVTERELYGLQLRAAELHAAITAFRKYQRG